MRVLRVLRLLLALPLHRRLLPGLAALLPSSRRSCSACACGSRRSGPDIGGLGLLGAAGCGRPTRGTLRRLLRLLLLLGGRLGGCARSRRRRLLHARQAVEEASHWLGCGEVQQQASTHQHEEAARRAVLVHHHRQHQQLQQGAHVEAHHYIEHGAALRLPRHRACRPRDARCAGAPSSRCHGGIVAAQCLGQVCRQRAMLHLLLAQHVGQSVWQQARLLLLLLLLLLRAAVAQLCTRNKHLEVGE